VLVVAVDPGRRKHLIGLVEAAGWLPLLAATSDEALEVLHEAPPDLVLLDVADTPAAELEVLDRFRADADGVRVPIVCLLTQPNRKLTVDAFARQADDVISTLEHPEELTARLRARMERPPVNRVSQMEDAVTGALTLASPHFVDFVRHIWVETPVAAVFAGGLLLYAVAMEWPPAKKLLGLAGVGALFGVGLLFKQAFAGFAPVAMAVVEGVKSRRRAWCTLGVVAVVALAVSAWWFLFAAVDAGARAEEGLWHRGILMRFTTAMDGHGRHPDDYAIDLDTYSGLVSFSLGLVGWLMLAGPAAATSTGKRLYWGWSVLLGLHYVIVGLAARTVTPWYQFVVLLPFLVGAGYLAVVVWNHREQRWLRWVAPLLIAVGVAAACTSTRQRRRSSSEPWR